ncbi:MAG: hypothetical protein PHC54_07225 [Candidatus Omnitrophica bacterium]|nr:hypothetical protein [Candidatus Omnitrophota bacterium]MDD5592978.1 hypothetical protein [Candidatus Omnitrophota bacterium]
MINSAEVAEWQTEKFNKSTINMIWNINTAYAIGLITTDGNLSKDGRHITFVSKDLSLVRLFRSCLGLKNKISYKNSGFSRNGKYYFVQFGNVAFYRNLVKIGITPHKSKSIEKLNIRKEFFPDFLRGHLDGDGTIRTYNDSKFKNCRRLYLSFISASKRHILWLQREIYRLYSIKGKVRPGIRVWTVIYAKQESIKLLKSLYYKNGLPFLTRKYNLIRRYL